MVPYKQPNNLGDVLKQGAEQYFSRDVVVLAQGQNLKLGTVVGNLEDGKITALDLTAQDPKTGAETAYGILLQDTDATTSDRETVIVARDAAVAGNALIWPTAITTTEKTAAIEQLKERGILIRKGA